MKCERLNWDLLVRAVDHELSPSEAQWVPAHIADCADCRRECRVIESVSLLLVATVSATPVQYDSKDRPKLVALSKRGPQGPDRVMRRFGWGMAIAATLALGIMVAPKQRSPIPEGAQVQQAAATASNAIEVDGETFVALPYSNPDLPSSAPRIVQMQVPASSLADVGIALEPIANGVFNQDRTVLADVLLGADGQPLGVHVVSWE